MALRLAVAAEDFGTSLRRAIHRAGQTQAEGIRLNARREILAHELSSTGLRQLRHYVHEHRMDIAALNCPTRHALADPDYLEPRLQLIRSAMDLARPLGTSRLLVSCGPIPDPDADTAADPTDTAPDRPADEIFLPAPEALSPKRSATAESFRTLCEVANDLAAHGNHVGCILTLEFPAYDICGMERLLSAITAGPVDIVFDPATAVLSGMAAVDTCRRLHHRLGFVRGRDVLRTSDATGTETAVGQGVVPWDVFLPGIIEIDYSGWLSVERTTGDDRAADVVSGIRFVRNLLPRVPDHAEPF